MKKAKNKFVIKIILSEGVMYSADDKRRGSLVYEKEKAATFDSKKFALSEAAKELQYISGVIDFKITESEE